ncbi:hypothetical protein HID58_087126, partial [Brassica napus]
TGPAWPFAKLDWSSSANGRAESVLGPARPFAKLDWSSSANGLANGRAESVSGPARPFAKLDWSSSANGLDESVLDDQIMSSKSKSSIKSRRDRSVPEGFSSQHVGVVPKVEFSAEPIDPEEVDAWRTAMGEVKRP